MFVVGQISVGARRVCRPDLILAPSLVVLFVASVYAFQATWSSYRALGYGFHDLGLINDWFTNALYGGRPFFVTENNATHLATHFTPSLLVQLPFYCVFNSQYLLVGLGIVEMYLGVFFQIAILEVLIKNLIPHWRLRTLTLAAFAVFYSLNLFTRRVIASGHCEPPFVLFASALAYLLLRRGSLLAIAALTALALGVREDSGVVLMLLIVTLPLLPSAVVGARRALLRRTTAIGLAGLAYTGLVVSTIMPLFGTQTTRLWSRYGASWTQVLVYLVTHPAVIWADIMNSGFMALNRSFFFLPALAGPMGIAANLAGLPTFTADDQARNQLEYYNSAMLLPGLFLAASVGFAVILLALKPRVAQAVAIALPLGLAALTCADLGPVLDNGRAHRREMPRDSTALQAIVDKYSRNCPKESVATDNLLVTWVPLRCHRYLLDHYDKADWLILRHDASMTLSGGMKSPRQVAQAATSSGNFDLIEASDRVAVFHRRAR
jgi:uncharacterized membrane protein